MENFQRSVDQFQKDWLQLQEKHSSLVMSSYKLKEEEKGCVQSVKHCRTYMRLLKNEIESLHNNASGDEITFLEKVKLDILKKEYILRDIEDVLPRTAGLYLRIVLGALNISFANKEDKFRYKDDYERFKIIISGICAFLSFLLYFFIQNRIVDTIFHFLLVWYYCTLTIRERILIANGSRIKGWWNISHFISTACAGIMLIWPRSRSYDEFRDQFMLFSLNLNLVHFIQYQYQISCLHKLRTLGCRHPMDITVDGFMSWMFRRLTFILPFLIETYGFELYLAYNLYVISQQKYCHEWQVLAVALIYFALATGSIVTVLQVIRQKIRAPPPVVLHDHLTKKYSFALPMEKLNAADIFSGDNNGTMTTAATTQTVMT
ncbi:Transmembrane protein [Schistosoma japonicum]|uniref:Transmembrane protein n=2 Tax=Schistosoma japonicum TaxID=6182 RepID=A0A4Z2D1W6_SCHJA|nr:Transmembrane protein [Schistosoma japonicum]TNN10502.1 Transmembrane protein [Schistosoma japonicum]